MKFSKTNPIKIILLGAGGTGGYIAPHLYRIAYTLDREIRIIIADGDIVEYNNLIRQNFAFSDVGENKAKILAERYGATFGIETEYISNFIEDEKNLEELVKPDYESNYYHDNNRYSQYVILIGAVDNNRSRKMCHNIFYSVKNLIYIDSGNGEFTGQVVCGVRHNGRTRSKPIGGIYKDILESDEKFPTELSCAERNVSAPQSITANLFAANCVISILYNILELGSLNVKSLTFSSKTINIKPNLMKRG